MMSCQLRHHSHQIPQTICDRLCWICLFSTICFYSLYLYIIILCLQAWCANCYGVTRIQGWVEHQANEEWVLLLGLMLLIGFCKRTILVQFYLLLLQLFWLVWVILAIFASCQVNTSSSLDISNNKFLIGFSILVVDKVFIAFCILIRGISDSSF